jgi:hypothetical protein
MVCVSGLCRAKRDAFGLCVRTVGEA